MAHLFALTRARGVAPGYINIAPLGLTLKPLLAPKGHLIKARGNAPFWKPRRGVLLKKASVTTWKPPRFMFY
ncbi:MAG: hypothetical protein B6247_03085 [Candidatus Parabeggiatoa sp. nov. 2]|nr:MAG: hypothetical protein B6247_03085 [Beggiatoa sp. 4572_84]